MQTAQSCRGTELGLPGPAQVTWLSGQAALSPCRPGWEKQTEALGLLVILTFLAC